MHPSRAKALRGTLPLPDNDIPCIRILVPGLDTGVMELTNAEYQAAVCAILNTIPGSGPMELFKVKADGEELLIPAINIYHAFSIARDLRPDAAVVTDTNGD